MAKGKQCKLKLFTGYAEKKSLGGSTETLVVSKNQSSARKLFIKKFGGKKFIKGRIIRIIPQRFKEYQGIPCKEGIY